ncbi:unnamed protein product [Euphydryas editha]|uniref:Uncharacterized protein n=1 Tax=Euphydryas editha TaxID=104508 RepID=A0AAU9UJ08_EUPED|nr:unnamed protein product [Euphydryas editha]
MNRARRRVNELGVVCAEMTAWCSSLAAEWLGALVVLCGAQHYPPPLYPDLLQHRDLHDAAAHDALAVFTCILIGQATYQLSFIITLISFDDRSGQNVLLYRPP